MYAKPGIDFTVSGAEGRSNKDGTEVTTKYNTLMTGWITLVFSGLAFIAALVAKMGSWQDLFPMDS